MSMRNISIFLRPKSISEWYNMQRLYTYDYMLCGCICVPVAVQVCVSMGALIQNLCTTDFGIVSDYSKIWLILFLYSLLKCLTPLGALIQQLCVQFILFLQELIHNSCGKVVITFIHLLVQLFTWNQPENYFGDPLKGVIYFIPSPSKSFSMFYYNESHREGGNHCMINFLQSFSQINTTITTISRTISRASESRELIELTFYPDIFTSTGDPSKLLQFQTALINQTSHSPIPIKTERKLQIQREQNNTMKGRLPQKEKKNQEKSKIQMCGFDRESSEIGGKPITNSRKMTQKLRGVGALDMTCFKPRLRLKFNYLRQKKKRKELATGGAK
ncbi:hypothetical protein VP01_431g3 [Puccinia sorghi]|uniref:Uncharacterized protein n=1 Tax=Puccinia sorghi TaxID=27349 RepID=A0A0L6UQ20_9BASI|nr:hypothetical protein VP01_431g3 [Puccinia sorghi]